MALCDISLFVCAALMFSNCDKISPVLVLGLRTCCRALVGKQLGSVQGRWGSGWRTHSPHHCEGDRHCSQQRHEGLTKSVHAGCFHSTMASRPAEMCWRCDALAHAPRDSNIHTGCVSIHREILGYMSVSHAHVRILPASTFACSTPSSFLPGMLDHRHLLIYLQLFHLQSIFHTHTDTRTHTELAPSGQVLHMLRSHLGFSLPVFPCVGVSGTM